MRGRGLAAVWLAASLSCHGATSPVQNLTVEIAVTPSALDFGPVYLQASATQTVTVQNQGTAPESATVTISDSAFTAVGGPTFALPPGATTSIPIAFNPTLPAVDQATAHVAWDEGSVDIALSGIGHAWPDCTPGAPCEAATFDPQSGVCVTSQLTDGALCDGGPSSCLQDSRCQAGQCVGVPLDCNPNACESGSCVDGQGCVYQEKECTGTDPCQVYSCDPSKGCTSSNAPNGTLCSNNESCQTADICIQGKCVGTPVPNGFPCALWWAPCATDAECQNGTCESPTANAEQPGDVRWSWQPDGGYPAALDVPAVDELGNSYVCSSSQTGGWESGTMDLASLDQCGLLRWENQDFHGVTSLLLAGQQLIFVDPTTNDVVALYRDTGQLLWQVDLLPSVLGDAADAGSLGCYQLQLSSLALSPTGPIYAAGTVANPCSETDELPQPFVTAILPNGTVAWTSSPILPYPTSFGLNLMVDRQGNSYLYEVMPPARAPLTGPYLASFDPQGKPRFVAPLDTQTPVLALGTDRIVEITEGQVWTLDGGPLDSFDAGLEGACAPGVVCNPNGLGFAGTNSPPSAAIDGQNNVYLFGEVVVGSDTVTSGAGLFAFNGSNPLWQDLTPGLGTSSNLVLGQGQLFFSMTGLCPEWPPAGLTCTPGSTGLTLEAVESANGSQLWTSQVATGAYPYPPATMTLANTATLILAYGGQVTGFFAGQQAPPDDAPWSRVGGSYWNQSSSAPPAQPSLPNGPTP